MAISDPQPFPFTGNIFETWDFDLKRMIAVNQSGAGQIQVADLADAIWTLKARTRPLKATQRAVWQAWRASMRGGLRRFWGYDPIKSYPLAYGKAGITGGWNGSATVTGTTAGTISLTQLPPNHKLSLGDHVSIAMTTGLRSLHMITEAVTASGGGSATVTVEPPVRAGAGTTAELIRARCVMVLKDETFSSPEGPGLQSVSFEAVQALV